MNFKFNFFFNFQIKKVKIKDQHKIGPTSKRQASKGR